MKYAKIVNNIVEQIQPNSEAGFIEVADDIVCGMLDNGDGTFSIIPKTQTELDAERVIEIDTRLDEIDRLTIRSLRSINRGRGNAQDDTTMTELDDEAIALRAERQTLTA